MFQIKFPSRDEYEFADTIYKLFTGGYMQATSVGLPPDGVGGHAGRGEGPIPRVPWRTYKRQDLLELFPPSPCLRIPLPSRNALARGVIQEPDFNRLRGAWACRSNGR